MGFLHMFKNIPTKQVHALVNALIKRGVRVETEHSDGHKRVDVYLPDNGMYIEIEGLQHFTSPDQILADLKRDYYSDKENHLTFRVTNQLIETHLDEIADAIAKLGDRVLEKI